MPISFWKVIYQTDSNMFFIILPNQVLKKSAVPQGSILGPLLFLLYINDMASCSKYLHFLLFADDTNLLHSNSDMWKLMQIINTELQILADWFRANRLSLNISKTNFMLFGYKKIPVSSDNIPTEFYLTIDNIDAVKAKACIIPKGIK